jgi:hypothetical protein
MYTTLGRAYNYNIRLQKQLKNSRDYKRLKIKNFASFFKILFEPTRYGTVPCKDFGRLVDQFKCLHIMAVVQSAEYFETYQEDTYPRSC